MIESIGQIATYLIFFTSPGCLKYLGLGAAPSDPGPVPVEIPVPLGPYLPAAVLLCDLEGTSLMGGKYVGKLNEDSVVMRRRHMHDITCQYGLDDE